MKIIKGSTKRGENLLASARGFKGYKLSDVYGHYSVNKARAYNDCLEKCSMENGNNFHICSHNSKFFSVAWETAKGVRLETAYNSYLIIE